MLEERHDDSRGVPHAGELRKLLRFTAMAAGTVLFGGWSMAVPVASGEPAGPDRTR
ncbi:hypothetical protein [Burkholderia gladioli]|uniref:hypothetical protein n=1 Tax=Burkholderia gladioli TaxID=28095 RepID=UPI00265AB4D7|nr:hypothetical protein [Burkholderia gladioli]